MASVWLVAIVCAMGFGATAYYVSNTPSAQRVPDEIRRPVPTSSGSDEVKKPEPDVSTSVRPEELVWVPAIRGESVMLAAEKVAVPAGADAKKFVVEQAMATCKIDARILGVEVKGGIAALDFNQDIQKGFGSMEEAAFIKSLQLGLGQFKDVDKFQVFVDGQAIDSLGHFELSGPVDVERP